MKTLFVGKIFTMVTENELRQYFREAIKNTKDDVYQKMDKDDREAVSDLLVGFLSQKQIDKLDYENDMNPQEERGDLDNKDKEEKDDKKDDK